ncbi:DUF2723 domain-containing protein [Litorilinea aerophila]|uniref:DUF2723 domain-containing protein n=1 Tax=Litorilinea aerophila TaxID=1204385 RepID=A0A540VJ92_9CHLR|nr:DUF2723 domain-containing protein [Litorilinea aerophila]MCC9076232.1 DUF2723 domain-containing protein [Litorilinea aerophila]
MVKLLPTARTDRQIVLLLMAATLALYVRMAAPDMLPGDSGEFQFAAWRLGLAHPTGYPLYLLLGSAWQHLLAVLGLNPAAALNLFSGVVGALAVGQLYRLMYYWLDGPAALRRATALFVAAYFAVNPTFWSQNLIAEVYTLHALFVLLILLAVPGLEAIPPARKRKRPIITTPRLVGLAGLVGLSLTHHAMTLLWIPPLLLALWLLDGRWWRSWGLLAAVGAGLAPLVLYLYIPLRSGPTASPWYHQRLDGSVLSLYRGDWASFLDFVTGRSISVGFKGAAEALAGLGDAAFLWRLHFGWPGLVLMALGLLALARSGRRPLLALTVTYALLQQLFNLFYNIGDILVYYIPLYLVATLWIGFGVHSLAAGHWLPGARPSEPQDPPQAQDSAGAGGRPSPGFLFGLLAIGLACLLPLQQWRAYAGILDQSQMRSTRQQWEQILAAQPPANAILVSNDRNEIVPLFYLQAVEGRAQGMTGLFPLIMPDPRFADIGATLDTALAEGGERPVYLIKAMPGLAVKYELMPGPGPLVQVIGPVTAEPARPVMRELGPLTLLGYTWTEQGDQVTIRLFWRVDQRLPGDFTTTVQLLDDRGDKLAQHDAPPGDVYYPTSLWKPGEVLTEAHALPLDAARQARSLLVGLYRQPDLAQLAPPLELPLAP